MERFKVGVGDGNLLVGGVQLYSTESACGLIRVEGRKRITMQRSFSMGVKG